MCPLMLITNRPAQQITEKQVTGRICAKHRIRGVCQFPGRGNAPDWQWCNQLFIDRLVDPLVGATPVSFLGPLVSLCDRSERPQNINAVLHFLGTRTPERDVKWMAIHPHADSPVCAVSRR